MSFSRPRLATLVGILALLATSGCSVLEPGKIDYKTAQTDRGNVLEVPPDLTQLSHQSRYQMPDGTVTASGYQAGQKTATTTDTPAASNQIGDVHYMRLGNERWLHVDRPANEIWQPVRDFWLENGFLLSIDDEKIGIMETDWAENRAKIPQDIIRDTIGKVFDSLYSTGERDRFRLRMELDDKGGTDIYVTHRGMEEVYTSSQRESTVWKPRPRDPELEIEFLRRIMVKLGVSQEQSKVMLAANATPQPAAVFAQAVTLPNGTLAVQLSDEFDRAWRRVGLALDRTGFTIEDRDRSKGLYFVRYIDPKTENKEPGFFGKLFGSSSRQIPTLKYQIAVHTEGQTSMVTVLNENGGPALYDDAKRIIKILTDDLK